MGLFDLPAPLFGAIDNALASVLPPIARLVVWAALAGAGTLALYRLLSPQRRIGDAKRAARQARARLNAFDGELAEAGPLIRDQFATAFRHLVLVVPGTLLSILPLLALLVWLDGSYARDYPPAGEAPAVATEPASYTSEWTGQGAGSHLRVHDGQALLADLAISMPVPVIEQRHWWNALVANPLGYLPENGTLQRVEIALPEREYLTVGPGWMRTWLAVFFPVMFVVSLLIFRWAKIQ